MDLADQSTLEAALEELPLFPLPQVVLFPGAFLPLHVFEPRYRALVQDCLATHRMFAVPLLLDPPEADPQGNPAIAPIAGAGLIVEHHALPDGRSTLVLQGQARVRLQELPFVGPYRRARATLLHEPEATVAPDDRTALLASASAFSAEVHKYDPRFAFRLPSDLSDGAIADHCAHHLVVNPVMRQALLCEVDPRERVRVVTSEIAQQHSALLHESGGLLH